MKVTSKGQVTIPLEIRRKLGIHANTEVIFKIVGNAVQIEKANSNRRGKDLVARLRGRGNVLLSTDQIMALTRGER